MRDSHKVIICKNESRFARQVAAQILSLSQEAVRAHGRFTLCLSGGSTPEKVYRCMASPGFRKKFPWKKIHLFWGDERWVPPTHKESNFRMVSQSLLRKSVIPPANIHSIDTCQKNPKLTALKYEKEVRRFFKIGSGQFPHFDLVLLGLGEDGHVASVFPRSSVLKEKKRLVVPALSPLKLQARISMTLPVLNHAGTIFFLVTGKHKAGMVQKIFRQSSKPRFPAQWIAPKKGRVLWFLDEDAGSFIRL